MILPDLNLLVHAYDADAANHQASKRWWEDLLSHSQSIFLAWVVALGFVRLVTQRRVVTSPYSSAEACTIVESWLARPNLTIVHPGHRHAEILFRLLRAVGTAGNLTTDAHLAALAIEHDLELHSSDADFARFPGLRWSNPLGTTTPPRRPRRKSARD